MLTASDVLQFIGWTYIGAAALAVALAVIFARGVKRKTVSALALLALFSVWPVLSLRSTKRQADDHTAKLKLATERFELRCKSAGEKIDRTVENVDGILLMNVRPKQTRSATQFVMDDPYGRNCAGEEDCIGTYLFDYKMVPAGPGRDAGLTPSTPRIYRFVDANDTLGQRYRYTKDSPQAPLRKAPASTLPPRYGVMWEDISTREDREFWIAGGVLKVVDLTTNEVIAERRGFLMDPGQGSTADDAARGTGRGPIRARVLQWRNTTKHLFRRF